MLTGITYRRSQYIRTTTHGSEGAFGDGTMHMPAPLPVAARLYADNGLGRYRTLPRALSTLACGPRGRNPLFAQTTGPLLRTRHQTTAHHPCHSSRPGLARLLFRLAASAGRGATRDFSPLASPRI